VSKTVGIFEGDVSPGGHPVWCSITDGRLLDKITFDHRSLSDLEHLVKEMRRMARQNLPENLKDEA